MDSFLNIKDRNLKFFSKAEFAIGNQFFLFLPMVVLLFLIFRPQHHGRLRIWTLIALVALQTDFVEKDVRNLDRIVRVRSPIALRASSLSLLLLGLLSVSFLLLRLPL